MVYIASWRQCQEPVLCELNHVKGGCDLTSYAYQIQLSLCSATDLIESWLKLNRKVVNFVIKKTHPKQQISKKKCTAKSIKRISG